MNIKTIVGSSMAIALVGAGVLAGNVIGADRASAQAPVPQASPTQVAPTTPGTGTTNPTSPGTPPADGLGGGGRHGHGGGHDGFGPGGFGGLRGDHAATAEGASAQITNTTTLIAQVKADLAYANGKMNTADVTRWIAGADSLLKSAQGANSSSQYGQAVAYAGAARELAGIADSQMAQKLGADKLPSYSQRPQGHMGHMGELGDKGMNVPSNVTLTQAQASRVLAETYNRLQAQVTQTKSAANASQAAPYLTDAENAYKAAYTAYQAGKYNDAVTSAMLAGRLGGVAEAITRASTAPANSDTPVTVPAPNFQ